MTQEGGGNPFGANASLLNQTMRLTAGPSSVGGDALAAGARLGAMAGRVVNPGRPVGFIQRPNPPPGIIGGQLVGAPGDRVGIRARSVTVTDGEGHGEFDRANFTYTVIPSNQNANQSPDVNNQTHLEPGDPVFVRTKVIKQFILYDMFNVGQLNKELEDNFIIFKSRVLNGEEEATRFQNYLNMYGESMLDQFTHLRQLNRLSEFREQLTCLNDAGGEVRTSVDIGMVERVIEDLKDMARLSLDQDKPYYALTRYGINAMWNFVGFVLTSILPLRTRVGQQFGRHTLSVNVTVKGNFDAILKREAPLAVKLLRRFVSELSGRLRKTNEALTEARLRRARH